VGAGPWVRRKLRAARVASHAGVRRSTAYRHFPDEGSLFTDGSSHWLAANPLPDLRNWAAVQDPHERIRIALVELYAYYGRLSECLKTS
jgi:hypothetical protein